LVCEALSKAVDAAVEWRCIADAHDAEVARYRFWIAIGECRGEIMTSQSQLVKRVAVSVWVAKVSENPAEKLRMQGREGCQRA
jgi:hypothetical protein